MEAAPSRPSNVMDPEEASARIGTAGRVLDGIDLRVVAEDGAAAGAGLIGRIEVRGAIVSPG